MYSLRVNYLSGAVDQLQNIDIATSFGGPLVNLTNRGLFISTNQQKLVVLHHDTRTVGFLGYNLSVATPATILFDAGGLTGFFGGCQLPNSNLVVGSDQWSGTKANEYLSTGTLVRTFNTTQTFTFSDCVAISNAKVAWIDYDALTDQNGDVVVSELIAGTWTETGRYNTNAQLPGLVDSMWYSLVNHTDGNLYVFPFVSGVTRNKKVLRCSSTGNLSDCQLIGSDLSTLFPAIDVIQGLAQLPGRSDIAFISDDEQLYLFNTSDLSIMKKADLSALLTANSPFDIRGFKIMPE